MTLQDLYRHLISLGITFVATFFLVMSFEVTSPNFVFSAMTIKVVALSGLIAASRSVAKIIYELCYNFLSTKK